MRLTRTKAEKIAAKKRKGALYEQHKQAATTAKFGQRRKPAPVTIKTLDGDVLRVVDQSQVST